MKQATLEYSDKKKIFLYVILTVTLIGIKYAELFTRYSFSGLWTSKLIFLFWVLSTGYILFNYWKSKIVKAYFFTLIFGSIILPFFAGILAADLIVAFFGLGELKTFRLNQDIIVQAKRSPLSGDYIVIFEDNMVFKKLIGHQKGSVSKNDTTELRISDALNAQLIDKSEKILTVKYNWRADSITLTHKIKTD